MQETSNKKQCKTCKCNDKQLLRCTRCKQIYYCGAQCQKKDWPQHKLICSKPKTNQQPKKTQQPLIGIKQFDQLKHIGSGNFSTIFKGKSKIDGKVYAIKQAEKAKLARMRKQADLFMQKHCLSKLKQCPYVVRLYQTFQDPLHLFLKMQCPQGGQLWEHSKHFGVIGQSVYKYYVCHLLKAIQNIHEQYQIVHRDLKPQNILLTDKHQIKIIDFGTAKDLSRPDIKGAGNGLKGRKPFQHYVGTPNYMAPQCIHNQASQKISDVYSLSGILFFLKVGSPPFFAGSQYQIFKKSLQNQHYLVQQLFGPVLNDLITKMNKKQMKQRLPLNQVMKHQYFLDVDFNNLPTYQQALQDLTPMELYLKPHIQYLIKNYCNIHEQPVQKKQNIYNQNILTYINEIVQNYPQKQSQIFLKRIQIIKIQARVMINLTNSGNDGFVQLYRQAKGIPEPAVLKSIEQSQQCQQTQQKQKDIQNIKYEQTVGQ